MNVFVVEIRDEWDFSSEYIAIDENKLSLEDIEGFVTLTEKAKTRLGIPVKKLAILMTREQFVANNKDSIIKDLKGRKWRYNQEHHRWEMIDK